MGETEMDFNGESETQCLIDDTPQNNAAIKIQKHYRQRLSKRTRKSSELDDIDSNTESDALLRGESPYSNALSQQQHDAAARIQRQFRKHLSDKNELKSYTDEEYIAALIIQNQYRNHLEKKKDKITEEDTKNLGELDDDFEMENAAIRIQKQYRKHLDKQEQSKQENSAIIIQKQYREHLDRQKDLERENAALLIQKQYKKHSNKREEERRQENAALVIQKQYKEHIKSQDIAKHELASKENDAAKRIQMKYRQHLQHRQQLTEDKAAVTIQNHYRKRLQYKAECQAAVKIQSQYRKHLSERQNVVSENVPEIASLADHQNTEQQDTQLSDMVDSDEEFLEEIAAITIQKHYRNHRQKKTEVELQATKQNLAAIKIQRNYRERLFLKAEMANVDKKTENSKTTYHDDMDNSSKSVSPFFQRDPASSRSTTPHYTEPPKSSSPELSARNALKPIIKKATKTKPVDNQNNKPFSEVLTINKNKPQIINVQKPVLKMRSSLDNKRLERKINKANKGKTDATYLQRLKVSPRKETVEKDKKAVRGGYKRDVTEKKKRIKSDTPRVRQATQELSKSLEPEETEPELLVLRESSDSKTQSDSKTPSLDVLRVDKNSSQSLISEEESSSPAQRQQYQDYQRLQNNTLQNNTLQNNTLQNNTLQNNALYQDYNMMYGAATDNHGKPRMTHGTPRRSNSNQQSRYHSVPLLGNLESYSVQSMLKKNELASQNYLLQNCEGNSYLHSYLKQMKLVNEQQRGVTDNSNPRTKKSNSKKREYQYQYQDSTNISTKHDIAPSPRGLEKIAGYGRNNRPNEWRSFVDVPYRDEGALKGVSRGSFYPVIPSYGQLQSRQNDDNELQEIPWPSDYG